MTKTFYFKLVSQPIGDFYVGSIPACELMSLAKANVRSIVDKEEARIGIQREPRKDREKKIKSYIEAIDATFPNSVILNVDEDNIIDVKLLEDGKYGEIFEIELKESEKTFSIIDGQHRLNGFDDNNCQDFDIIVSVFLGLNLELQAYIFTSVNVNQKSVDKSLAYDLFDLAETPSPQKTAHIVVSLLNSEKDSPLYRAIRLLGKAPLYDGELLYKPVFSQGTIIQRLIKLISRDPDKDRHLERNNERIPVEPGWLKEGLIFRKFYVERQEWAIYKILLNYFNAAKRAFGDEWEAEDSPFRRTIGLGALFRFLVDVYKNAAKDGDASEEYFDRIFSKLKNRYDIVVNNHDGFRFTMRNYGPAGSSEGQIYNFLRSLAGYSDLDEFIAERKTRLMKQGKMD